MMSSGFLKDPISITAAVAGATALAYSSGLHGDFVFDDVSAIKENADIRLETPILQLFLNDFWGRPLTDEESHKSYRPITVLSFRLNYYFGLLNPVHYHVTNVVLHILNTGLFLMCICKLGYHWSTCVFSAFLFALHPIHTEAVTGLVGRAECLSCFFFLLSMLVWLSYDSKGMLAWILVTMFADLATFSKEQGITVFAILICFELLRDLDHKTAHSQLQNGSSCSALVLQKLRSRPCLIRIVLLLAIAISILLVRLYALKGSLPHFTEFDNPAAHALFPTRLLTFNYLVALNFWLQICPCSLLCDWSMGTVPLVQELCDIRTLATLVFYCCVIIALLRAVLYLPLKNSVNLLMPIALAVITFLPSSNMFVYVGFVVAERVLYLPSLGFCLLIGHGTTTMLKRWKNVYVKTLVFGSFTVCLLSFSAKCYLRNFDWQNDLTLFTSALRITQRNAKAFNNVGHHYENTGQFSEALQYFNQASVVQPDDVGAWNNVGRVLMKLERLDEAESLLQRAKDLLMSRAKSNEAAGNLPGFTRIAPGNLYIFINLANLYKSRSSMDMAESILRELLQLKMDFLPGYLNLGDVLLSEGRVTDAQALFLGGLEMHPDNADLLYNIGLTYLRQAKEDSGKINQPALVYFEEALRRNSNHYLALVNSASLLEEHANWKKDTQIQATVKQRLQKAIQLQEKAGHNTATAGLYVRLASILHEFGENFEAEKLLEKALQLHPLERSVLYNLAVLQLEASKHEAVMHSLKLLTSVHKEYVSGWLLLAHVALQPVTRDRSLAAKAYETVLNIEPFNVQATHNLCIVYIELRRKDAATKCIEKAKSMLAVKDSDYTPNRFAIIVKKFSNQNW